MASFDGAAFVTGVLVPVREAVAPLVSSAAGDARELLADVERFAECAESTLLALAVVNDERVLAMLKDDMARYLPARRDAIVARAVTILATDAQALLETVLTVAEKAAITAAKSFIL